MEDRTIVVSVGTSGPLPKGAEAIIEADLRNVLGAHSKNVLADEVVRLVLGTKSQDGQPVGILGKAG